MNNFESKPVEGPKENLNNLKEAGMEKSNERRVNKLEGGQYIDTEGLKNSYKELIKIYQRKVDSIFTGKKTKEEYRKKIEACENSLERFK